MIMVSNLKTKLATLTLLALTLVAISIPVMATVIQGSGTDTVKDCAVVNVDNGSVCTPPAQPAVDENATARCGTSDASPTLDENSTVSDGICAGDALTAAETPCTARTINSCDGNAAPDNGRSQICNGSGTASSKPRVCNGSKICNGSKAHSICNGSSTRICNSS